MNIAEADARESLVGELLERQCVLVPIAQFVEQRQQRRIARR